MLLLFLVPVMPGWAEPAITQILGCPTTHSIAVNVRADSALELYCEYGAAPGNYPNHTVTTTTAVNEPAVLTMNGLAANTRTYYRVRYRTEGSATAFSAGTESSFMTQRAPGSTFVFAAQGDSHPERQPQQFLPARYTQTMLNVAAGQPDFYFLMGDDFSIDQFDPLALTQEQVAQRYTLQLPYLTQVASGSPLFLVNGNHEQAARYLLNGTANNPAVWAQNARNKYYPQPAPDGFYTGNTETVPFIGQLRNYFAWTWGDALFVVIDPYWESPVVVDNDLYGGPKTANKWQITHGDAQYQWLKSTLEQSQAKYKFVFAHHAMGMGRGGAAMAKLYEWGGYNQDGATWAFNTQRPAWPLPIHQLMAANHVTIFFHGHDHLFAKENMDGVVYQELPQPADYETDGTPPDNVDAYPAPAVSFTNGGHVRVTVSPTSATVEYVRTQVAGDGVANGRVSYSYDVYPYIATPATPAPQCVLGRPTSTSIAVNVFTSSSLQAYLEYGPQAGGAAQQTTSITINAGSPATITLNALSPDTPYAYHLRYRAAGVSAYATGPEGSFHTQRATGKGFTFDIEADPHYHDFNPDLYTTTLNNILADKPDFLIDLGDTFMTEKFKITTQAGAAQYYLAMRTGFLSRVGCAMPLFLVNGNHESELGWLLDSAHPQANMAVWATQLRQLYFPCPVPGSFYSGATVNDPYTQAPRDGYYSFTWGDALFVILDPFWYTTAKPTDGWDWTLGRAQYDWLARTLAQSNAQFKFVFLHNLVGGSFDGQARGGVEFTPYFEWGGLNSDGTAGFAAKRPGWARPIQDLLLGSGVQAVFHGHDHFFARQELDADHDGRTDLIYQECPQPGFRGNSAPPTGRYGYVNGDILASAGHLRLTVSSTGVKVEYIRAWLPQEENSSRKNGETAFSYTIAAPTKSAVNGSHWMQY